MANSETVDILIIGSGMGGATTAAGLAPTGARILILERGARLRDSADARDARAIFQRGVVRPDETWLDGAGRSFNPGNYYYVGGNSKLYGAVLLRYRAQDFEPVVYRDGATPGWPFSYEELELWYGLAEKLYKVRGAIGFDPTEPKHSAPYPFDPVPDEPAIGKVRERLKRVGLHPFPLPLGVDIDKWLRRAKTPWDAFPDTGTGKMDAETCALDKALAYRNVNAQTLKIEVQNNRAIGVTVVSGTGTETLNVDREIIISCGAIGSPRLLQLSGIGPADALKAAGVNVVHDLPGVGSNMQDHLDLYAISECTGEHTYDRIARPHRTAWAGLQYLAFKTGPVTSTLFETGGFWYADKQARSPDIQFHLGLGSGIEAGVAAMKNPGVTLNSAFLRPRSRGTVRIASPDPTAAPLIDPNYWADPYDRECSIRGLRMARELLRQPALKPFVMAERMPGDDVRTDEQLAEYAYRSCKTDHHPAGTCAMGSGADAVVTPDLKLRGLLGIRVVDASVMPFVPSSNTNAPTIMVAEKASDMILGKPPLPAAPL